MGRYGIAIRYLLLAGMATLCLSACGGSDSGSSPSTTIITSPTSKTATWTNVSVRSYDGKININWDKAAGSSPTDINSALSAALPTYNIYCSTDPTDIMKESNRIATRYEGQSFDHTNVINGQRYYYVVTEVNAAGEGVASRPVSATPQAVLPTPPFGLKVTALDTEAILEFMGPTPPKTGSVSYNLYRSTTKNSFTVKDIIEYKYLFTTAAVKIDTSTYTDTSLTNGTTYYYAVTSVISGKESGFSPIVAARPQAAVAAGKTDPVKLTLASFASPANMSAEPRNVSAIITWSDVAPLELSESDPTALTPYYILYWSDTPDVLNGVLKNIKGQIDNAAKVLTKDPSGVYTFKLSGLNNGSMYYLQLVAAVTDANGVPLQGRFTPGTVVAVTPALRTPVVPSGVTATQGSQQVSLSWSKDTSGISGVTYNVFFSTTDAATPEELMAKGTKKNSDDSTKAYYTHSGLQPGQTYYYVVTAVGDAESAPSNIISVTL